MPKPATDRQHVQPRRDQVECRSAWNMTAGRPSASAVWRQSRDRLIDCPAIGVNRPAWRTQVVGTEPAEPEGETPSELRTRSAPLSTASPKLPAPDRRAHQLTLILMMSARVGWPGSDHPTGKTSSAQSWRSQIRSGSWCGGEIVGEPVIGPVDALAQADPGLPAERAQVVGIHEFARGSIRFRGIEVEFAPIPDDFGD